jgi:hypothetical protein
MTTTCWTPPTVCRVASWCFTIRKGNVPRAAHPAALRVAINEHDPAFPLEIGGEVDRRGGFAASA